MGLKSKIYSYIKEDYEKFQLQITKKDDSFKFQMVAAKDDEKSIKKYLDVNNKTAKGVKKNIIKKEIEHNNYKNFLFAIKRCIIKCEVSDQIYIKYPAII